MVKQKLPKGVGISVSLPLHVVEKIEEISIKHGTGRSRVAARLIELGLKAQEEEELMALAKDVALNRRLDVKE